MTAPIPPTTDPIYDAAAKLLACLTVEVQGLALVPKNIGFLPGAAVLEDLSPFQDLCCEGTAYVRHASTYPSGENFPAPDTGQNPCSPLAWGVVFEMGVMRCTPSGTLNEIITMDQWNNVNTQYYIDSAALRAAVCCYKNLYASGANDNGILIGQTIPVGPQGGCLIASLNVTIQVIGCGGC